MELLKLDDVRRILAAINDLELDAYSCTGRLLAGGRQTAEVVPSVATGIIGFVRDLAEVAEEIGIPVTTDGNPAAAEPPNSVHHIGVRGGKSAAEGGTIGCLTACEQRIGRAIRELREVAW